MSVRYLACVLALCSASALARGLAEEPPKGLDLNGTWQLNTALSDDAHKIVEAERARHLPRPMRGPPPADGPRPRDDSNTGRTGDSTSAPPSTSSSRDDSASGSTSASTGTADSIGPTGSRDDSRSGTSSGDSAGSSTGTGESTGPAGSGDDSPSSRTNSRDSAGATRGPGPQNWRRYRRDGLDELLQAPARMTIEHAGARFAFITPKPVGGERRTEFRAGTKSVVSATHGVADREVGWSRNAFVISTRAVEGLRKEERYQLDSDGRLRFTTEVRGEEIRKLVITRIYDRVTANAPPPAT